MLSIRDLRQAEFRIANGLLDGMMRRGRSDSRQRHRPVGSASECGGLDDLPSAHTVGIASRLAPGLVSKVDYKLQRQVSIVWHGCEETLDVSRADVEQSSASGRPPIAPSRELK
jgi:hypothetical protein